MVVAPRQPLRRGEIDAEDEAQRVAVGEVEVAERRDRDVEVDRVDVALVDSTMLEIAQQFEPEIQATLEIGEPRPIVWLFGPRPNGELLARTGAFYGSFLASAAVGVTTGLVRRDPAALVEALRPVLGPTTVALSTPLVLGFGAVMLCAAELVEALFQSTTDTEVIIGLMAWRQLTPMPLLGFGSAGAATSSVLHAAAPDSSAPTSTISNADSAIFRTLAGSGRCQCSSRATGNR